MPNRYTKVISEAVADILANGYDSPERVAFWIRQIQGAASERLGTPEVAARRLRQALETAFVRQVDGGLVLRRHRGVSPEVLNRLRPLLQTELERRVLAATTLVRMNYEKTVDTTLRRFVGWATAVPPGGTSAQTRAEAKRPLRDLEYVDNRLYKDQEYKMIEALSHTIGEGGGAIAARWRSRWRDPGYNYRKEHKHRDEEIVLLRNSPALAQGLVKRAGHAFMDEIEFPGEWPHCQCWYDYIYTLDGVPEECLTAKGRSALVASRRRT